MPNPPPKEDTWAFQKIGTPYPPNPVKVLQYTGDHNTQGFWYEWILYKDRFDKAEGRQLLHCGDSFPILWKDRPEGALLGYVDNKTEIALFSCDGKVYEKKGGELANMYIIMRNLIGGPPHCECSTCRVAPPPPGPPPPRVMIDEWMDIRAGDPWPDRILVKALDKTLDTIPGENPDQYVALWYQAGEPVMGRIWNENGKVAANFCWNKNEYKGNVGSIQVLVHLSEHVRGFDYQWLPYPQAASFDKDKEWIPVHVNNTKGDISSGVITFDGKQILGKVDVRNEKSSAGFGGKENMLVGPACANNTIVLCRKARPGYKFD
ncbi:hypothetical protein TELCIR_19789 [Teladorsagia circumcincta]|uniref:Uncharacterized protein n=1 Tax=Teladorsagia circumcincta TaxID=45464 RepID=A0A2G9TLL7_TELCI|nr:hypothetical protein TELCIR_19789 [Teladorsagia circumcincta]